MMLLLIPILPLLAALCALLRPRGRIAAAGTIAAAVLAAAGAARTAMLGAAGTTIVAVPGWIACDGLSALVLLLVAAVNVSAAIFSWGYVPARLAPADPAAERRYYINYNLFVSSLLLVPLVLEPALVWIMIELTTLLSVFLVGFDRTRGALEAAWKYVVLTLMGAAIALLGVLLMYWALWTAGGRAFTWDGLVAAAPHMPAGVIQMAFLLVLVGFGAKIGLVPLHTWIPAAYSYAPSPICALLSGAEATAVLYVVLRLVPVAVSVPAVHVSGALLAFGLLSVAVAVFLILQTSDYKRLFAYSTIEHMGIILVAAGLGGALASYGAVAQLLTHSVTKAFCFLAVGSAVIVTNTRDTGSIRGLVRTSPVAGIALLLGGLAIAGAPPFAVFLSEFAIFRAGVSEGHAVVVALLAACVIVGFVAIMVHVNRMVFGSPTGASGRPRLPAACVVALAAAVVPVVALGLYVPRPVFELLSEAARWIGR